MTMGEHTTSCIQQWLNSFPGKTHTVKWSMIQKENNRNKLRQGHRLDRQISPCESPTNLISDYWRVPRSCAQRQENR
jgi:hypothetical protein